MLETVAICAMTLVIALYIQARQAAREIRINRKRADYTHSMISRRDLR